MAKTQPSASALSWSVDTITVETDTQIDYIKNDVKKTKRTLIFTFANLQDAQGAGLGYGGKFLLEQGYDIIAFKTARNRNNWFQGISESAFEKIEQAITASGRKYKVRAGYGSSMGGFGALAFSRLLKMDIVVAISPQIDITQDWDTRWGTYAKKIKFRYFINSDAISKGCKYYLVCDPYDPDYQHASRFQALAIKDNVTLIKLPYSGHPSGHFLSEIGRLKTMVVDLFSGKSPDLAGMREGRRISAAYLSTLADVCVAKNKLRWATDLYKSAIALMPTALAAARLHTQVSEIYTQLQQGETARLHALEAVKIAPSDSRVVMFAADLLAEHNQIDQGLQIIENAIGMAEQPVGLHKRKVKYLEKSGKTAEAINHLQLMLLKFHDPAIHFNLSRIYLSQLAFEDARVHIEAALSCGQDIRYLKHKIRIACDQECVEETTSLLKQMVDEFGDVEQQFVLQIEQKIARYSKK
ncbi:tetratricopeptide repeat protein [Methylobacillus flagellatus]|uniref:tetratricopeptide repeat protein n=1 Tax=Methylobacillus flagellatus TaxID=405 RepID=UPI0010F4CA8E|nr:hypothetical protein [Methylobacillus flagellatus]